MIFEKTLARKIIGAPKKAEPEEQHSNGTADGPAKIPLRSKFHPVSLWGTFCSHARWLVGSKAKSKIVKEPASMGKILNLMRYVCNPEEVCMAYSLV